MDDVAATVAAMRENAKRAKEEKRLRQLEGNRRRNVRWKENNPEHVAKLNRDRAMRYYNKNHDEAKARLRERAKKRWESMTPDERRDRAFRANYGVTLAEFNAQLEKQNFRCAACETDDPGKKGWQLDHCHKTGKGHMRGVLCHHCNTGLGLARDNPAVLRQWIKYLER